MQQTGQLFPNLLGISLLQECTPELIAFCRMHKHQLPVFDRQSVIYHNIDPFAKLPELQDRVIIINSMSDIWKWGERVDDNLEYLEVEDSRIVVLEGLPVWDDPM